ncbi:MAG: nitroreductase family deazaflavin-dependent oxidoreductase [Anaerolineae bacterium]
MTMVTPDVEAQLRQGFKYLNRLMVFMWRLGLGKLVNMSPTVGGRIMVLTHTGRKSGLKRRTPVNYAEVDGELYCTAGFGAGSDWYRNILAHPEVEIWLPDGWYSATAEDISDAQNRLFLLRQVLIASAFAARAVGLNPVTMTGDELDASTSTYKLIHIRRGAALTGDDGPGDLSWMLPLAGILLLPLLLPRRRKHH